MSTFYIQAGRMNNSLERTLLRESLDTGASFPIINALSSLKRSVMSAVQQCAAFADEYRAVARQAEALSRRAHSRYYW